jgi:hypothetical protein
MANALHKDDKVIAPLLPKMFGLAEHRFRRFNAIVSPHLNETGLEDPDLWAMIAPQLRMGDEIRAVAEDNSFVALLFVTFAQGTDARVKVVYGSNLDAVDHDEINREVNDYQIMQKGQLKWCIVKMSTGERIKENIPTQAEAQKELEEYRKVLRT